MLSVPGIIERDAKKLLLLNYWINQLTNKPISIQTLTNLHELDISRKQLTALNPSLRLLTNLLTLNIWSNKLTDLPASISVLTKLQFIDISLNRLDTFPELLTTFTNLQSLNLASNQLTALPSLVSLTSLHKFDIHSNRLATLPLPILTLNNLQMLNLASNRLSTLPASISVLSHLQRLELQLNRLQTLPSSISALVHLKLLLLDSNNLLELPSSLSALTNLQQLYSRSNLLLSLPARFPISLKELYLRANQLEKLPLSVLALTNLQKLDLALNKLAKLPSAISSLMALEELHLSANQLNTLPSSIVMLTNLIAIELEENPLKLPPVNVATKGIRAIRDFYDKAIKDFELIEVPQKKIVIVGEGGVGKTSLVKRLEKLWLYRLRRSSRTEGVDIHNIELSKGKFVSVWDFAGQEHFLSSHKLYFTKDSVFIIAIPLTDNYQQIHNQLSKWMFIVHQLCPDSKVIVIGTKLDLVKQTEITERLDQINHAITTLQKELQINLEFQGHILPISNDKKTNIPEVAALLRDVSQASLASSFLGSAEILKFLKSWKEMCITVKAIALKANLPLHNCIKMLRRLEELGMVVYLESNEQDEEATVILDGDVISKAFNKLKIECKDINIATKITGWIDYNLARATISNSVRFKLFIEVVEKAKLVYVHRSQEMNDWKIFIPQICLDHNTEPLYQHIESYSVGRVYWFKHMLPVGFFEHLAIQMQFFATIANCEILISKYGIKLERNSETVFLQKIKLGSLFESAVQIITCSCSFTLMQQVLEAFEECVFSYFQGNHNASKFVKRLAICSCNNCQIRFRNNSLTMCNYLPLTANDKMTESSVPLFTKYSRAWQFAGCIESNASIPIANLLIELKHFDGLPLIKEIQMNPSKIKGRGASGTVMTGTLPNNDQVAVKVINDLQSAIREIKILRMLEHPYILKIIGYSYDTGTNTNTSHMYIITELLDKTLTQFIHESKCLLCSDLVLLLKIAVGISEGVAYLHSQSPPIIHRDIKPDNIMLDKEMKVRIIDFSIAKLSTLPYMYERKGTGGYCAPEVIGQIQYNTAADIYSFGRVLQNMCGNISHFQEDDQIWLQLIEQLNLLIVKCTSEEPSHRPTALHCVTQLQNFLEQATQLTQQFVPSFGTLNLSSTQYLLEEDLPRQILNYKQLAKNTFANEGELKQQLKTHHLRIRDNEGNGDCLPFSLIDYLIIILEDFTCDCDSLRQRVANYVQEHWQQLFHNYSTNIGAMFRTQDQANQWAERYRRPQEWCENDFAMICAVIFKFRVELFVVNEHNRLECIMFEPIDVTDLPTVRLAYVNNNHYVSVWPTLGDE